MSELPEHIDILQAHNLALLALNDLLIDSGVLGERAWGDQLRRYRAPADRPRLQAIVAGLSTALDARHFRSTLSQPPVKIVWNPEKEEEAGSTDPL